MLVIQLKANECVSIGDDIKLWNRETHMVKVAIEAPREIAIVRETAKDKTPRH